MVSFIQSNYFGFGSGLTPPKLGFPMQNRGALFTLEAGHFNVYEPGKRPFHTIIPAFVTKEGKPWLCFGVMGGDMQPQGHVQILMNMIDFGMNLQEAGDAPRVRHVGSSPPTGGRVRARTAAARSWNRCTMASRSSSGLDTAQSSSGDSDGPATGPTAGSSVTSSTSSGGSMVGIRSSRSSPSSSRPSAVVGG